MQRESNFAENALEVQVDNNLTISQQLPAASWAALGGALKQDEGGGPPPLLSTGETHLEYWVLFWAPQYLDLLE